MINSINADEKQDDFIPSSGVTNRWLYKENVNRGEGDSIAQALGRKDVLPPSNPNDYVYSRTIEFPQPSIAGIGAVTSAGAKDTTSFFFSQSWKVAKTAAGKYTITHGIGDNKYNVTISPIATTAFTANLSARNINDFQVSTFNAAGAASDCAFTFTLWIIP